MPLETISAKKNELGVIEIEFSNGVKCRVSNIEAIDNVLVLIIRRNRNLQEIRTFGRMSWQKVRDYGNRNYSELCIQRYKQLLGNKLHAREFTRQKNEATLG